MRSDHALAMDLMEMSTKAKALIAAIAASQSTGVPLKLVFGLPCCCETPANHSPDCVSLRFAIQRMDFAIKQLCGPRVDRDSVLAVRERRE